MTIPKVVERKLIESKKPGGSRQYLITIPKDYAEALKGMGVDTFIVVYNRGLGAFPKVPGMTEEALLTFLKEHPELERLFSEAEHLT